MKIAIVQDELVRKGGAERVVLLMKKAFPEAPIYTLAYNPNLTFSGFSSYDIRQTWFGKLARNEKWLKRLFFPFGIWAMRRLDLRAYDVLLISSTHVGKYTKVGKNSVIFNYCHTPFRLAWQPESYSLYSSSKGGKKIILKALIKYLQKIDLRYAKRSNFYLTNSKISKERIDKIYQPTNSVKIIPPPVSMDDFYKSRKSNYYLLVSRLEDYKKADIVIKAFNILGEPLVVVGHGSQKESLVKLAKANITFKENLSQEELSACYANAEALIFPQYEDYGITPLEANASGIPVIAFGQGGVKETMIPFNGDEKKATALFFFQQTEHAIVKAINKYQNLNFDQGFIISHARKFREESFIAGLQAYIKTKLKND